MVDPAPEPAKKRRRSLLREIIETVILAAVIFLAVRAALQNFRVQGASMEPNLHSDEYILVDKVDYLLHSPQRDDIIVFHAVPAGQPDSDFIKRVIALPGETVAVHNGTVYINGHGLSEKYVKQPPAYVFGPKTVPRGDYFVLGDNRNDSFDSHAWPHPFLPRHDIIGKALVSYWPPADVNLFSTVFPWSK
jgi:signal peptidase I